MLVDIRAQDGLDFNTLVENPQENNFYLGAWVNILVEAADLETALSLLTRGLNEKGFEVKRIGRVENFEYLVSGGDVAQELVYDGEWLLSSEYIFLICEPIYPYSED